MADEYIRKQDVVDKINANADDLEQNDCIPYAQGARAMAIVVEQIPSADVVPVVHGEWLPTNDDNKKRCNKCDMVVLIAMYPSGSANFCPNCGAKMVE